MTVTSPDTLHLPGSVELSHDTLSKNYKGLEEGGWLTLEEGVRKFGEFPAPPDTQHGISLLELKNHTILQYLINLLVLTLSKVEGKDIEDTVRWRPIVNRTVIERIRPIEQKLQYQIDAVLRSAGQENAARQYKPQLGDLDSSEEGEEETGAAETSKYRVPKVAAVHYYEPEPRNKKKAEDSAGPALGRGILEELRQEMSSLPVECSHSNREKQTKRARQRQEFEESNFLRMNLSKSEKKKSRLQSGLNSILDFDDQEMFRSAEAERAAGPAKRRKKGKGGKKGTKFKKRR